MKKNIYKGILFIGDPHAGSRKPGRRQDDGYIDISTGKLEQSLNIADEKGLLPICLGDLIDKQKDNNIYFIAKMMQILSKHKNMICPLGNHDKSEVEAYSKTDTINVIDSANLIHIISEPSVAGVFNIQSDFDKKPKKVGIYCVPYGFDIPNDISDEFEEKVDHVIMVTHHDLVFDPVFAHIEMKEIKGCDMVVNGHLHKTFPHQDFGQTRYFNPGNIMRMSATEKDHEPSVWSWTNGQVTLDKHILEYEKDIFDLTGYNVEASEHIPMDHHSVFVDILKTETNMEANASEDGSILGEDINKIIDDDTLDDDVVSIIKSLHTRSVEEIGLSDNVMPIEYSSPNIKL